MKIYNCYFDLHEVKYMRVIKIHTIDRRFVVAENKRNAYFRVIREQFGKGAEDDEPLSWFSTENNKHYELPSGYTLETAITEVSEDVYMRIWGAPELPLIVYL